MAVNRIRYRGFKDAEGDSGSVCERTSYLKLTLDRGLNEASTFRFVVPADGQSFTDTNSTYMTVDAKIVREDGTSLSGEDRVFLGPGALQSLFSSCEVLINGVPVSVLNNYSYASTLSSYLGNSKLAREDIWSQLSGAWTPQVASSLLIPSDEAFFVQPIQQASLSQPFRLTGRISSDFLMSLTQMLTPKMSLELLLNRNPHAFVINTTGKNKSQRFKLDISSMNLFVRRVRMSAATLTRTMESIGDGGMLRYTKLHSLVTQIPDGTLNFSLNNAYQSGDLPYTCYVMFVSQRAFNGSFTDLPNYMESGGVRSVRFLESGRDVSPEVTENKFVYLKDGRSLDTSNSDASKAFLGMYRVLDSIAQPVANVGMSYNDFLSGCIFYACQLNSCGGRKVGPGFLDIQVTFDETAPRPPLLMLVLGEFEKTVHFDTNHVILNT